MEISPALQFQMLLTALLAGLFLGALSDVGAALRILLGVHTPPAHLRALYARPLPLIRRPVPFREERVARRVWRQSVIIVGDVLFCLVAAVAVELILYEFNRGAFRLAVPILVLVGFALWRMSVSRIGGIIRAYLAYGISAMFLYLRALVCLPVRFFARVGKRFVLGPLRRRGQHILLRHRARITARLCRLQLESIAEFSVP